MATRYIDTGTVSDEHGKGAEILRQQVTGLNRAAGANTIIMVAEVDMIIRNVNVTLFHSSAITAGSVRLRKLNGSDSTDIAAVTDVRSTANAASVNELTVTNNQVSKGEVVVATVGTAIGAGGVASVHVGWMPNIWSDDGNFRSYALPA